MVGDDITLPCHVKPASDVFDEMLEWSRPDLNPRFVHVRRSGEDLLDQNPSYRGRTSVSINSLKQGDVSLKLSKVKFSDEGTYRCFIPGLKTESNVQLVVGPVINIIKVDSGVLQCESTGWYPEREVFWLDGEGNLLSAGPTETVRGPDGLYTVSSRVTVEKRHNNNFTCRVQQKNINQIRETNIIVPDDFFTESSRSSASTVIGVIVGIIFILAVVFLLWKWRQNKLKTKKCHGDKDKWKTRDKKSNSTSNGPEQESLIKEDETQSTNNKTAGQGPIGGERQQEDQQAGGETKDNLDQTGNEEKKDSCPAKEEGQQDKDKDGRDGEENLREPIKDNKKPQSPADGQTDQHPAPVNSTAVQGPIPGGTQQDETRAEQQPSTEETEKQSDVDKRQGDKNKTEQLTVEQPEKSPESTDGEENTTPEKDDTISQPPVSGQTNQPQAGKTELDEKDAEEEPKPKDNKTTDQVPTEVETEHNAQQEEGETKDNLDQTGNEEKKDSCPAKEEGQQDKDKDGRDGEENLREPIKDNKKPQSPADGQTDQHPAPVNSTAVQGPIPGGTQQDETRAEQQPSTEETEKQSDVDKRQGDKNKTEQLTVEQPEKSPESTDGEENTTSNGTSI
ncbi:spore wall protein 2-like [Thunnus albacares]|uniref:spore wall protein 2-like n=1 Tax=Thunnus albacares TaxID=8236 RepID=UPI001CF6D654|nr:spore wall protein 2-like [Thunnus albacares]